jgi:uncharacterized surface protein with fasciclin (FAS1) repeats
MPNWIRRLAAPVAVACLVAACGGGDDPPPPQAPSIVQVAQSDAGLSTLAEAVVAADLATTLSGPGPYTVFAPTNDAFASLLAELGVTKAQLLADKPLLTQVLTYHVLPAAVTRAAVPAGRAIGTVQGSVFKVDASGNALIVTDGRNRTAAIVATDIAASNGVVHVVDKVLLPPNRSVVQTALAQAQFSLLAEAVMAAGLDDDLGRDGPFTVFAPTDAAFTALLAELGVSKAELFADTALLTRVLAYHVVPGRVMRADVPVGAPVTTLQGGSFTIDANLRVIDARGRTAHLTATDVFATNGVLHVLDRVLLPAP